MSPGSRPSRSPFRPLSPSEVRAYLRALERFGIKLGLDNIRVLLHALGDPHLAFPSIHVAGTNGKGSVCAMLDAVLRADGRRTGLYTSPHLVDVRERIRVGGRMIGRAELGRLLGRIRGAIDGLLEAGRLDAHPTFFEVLTTLAFLHFANRKVDIAILEVGLGGRFDATNVVTPLVSAITSIALDHREHLGGSLAAIAGEKAGIIKPGVPVVCGPERGAARAVIKARAAELQAPFRPVFGRGRELLAARTPSGLAFRYASEGDVYEFVPGLRGEHQGVNAATAIAVLRELDRLGRGPTRRAVMKGLTSVRWEGRLEVVGRRPAVFLDGAHNEEGARAVARFIRDEIRGRGRFILVFAMMRDKAIRRSARLLFPPARRIILTGIPFTRAASPEEILKAVPEFARKIVIEPDLLRALRLARREAGPAGVVLVAGSLYLVGEVKKLCRAS
ncbi:MAG: bifunctional folylpolyglutamate synthase/dihydrofolate synthase [Acidobacteriota bacterium]|nr:bifunctional folylpolyglutamate synthase/dihydrofolate synthase [Acidobacteriota bacterium]